MSFEIGEITGDYEIVSVLGSGGMGKVYKVRNTLSDRFDAMKVLLPDLTASSELADRFLREIKVQARLNHPNIVSLYTALRVNNQLLMIMELVEGHNLDQEIHRGSILYQDAEGYLIQVLSALDYAHKNGVVHRDIKPANIILMPSGQVKLMDFGIARVSADRSLTKTGIALGTLFYMSPEQIHGERPDARSDIYSLGVTFYEVLTGKKPINGDSDFSIMSAHLLHVPLNPVELNPMVPPALAEVILKSLAKSADERFQTAEEFLAAVIEAKRNPKKAPQLHGEILPPPATPPIPAPGKTRHMVWIAATAVVLLAGIGVARFSGNRGLSSTPPAVSQQSTAPAAASAVAIQPIPAPAPPAAIRLPAQSAAIVPPSRPATQQAAPIPIAISPVAVPQMERLVQTPPRPAQSAPQPPQSATPQPVPSAPAARDPRAILQEDWDRVSNSKDISALQDFQRKHPDSSFARQAAARIELHSWELAAGSKDAKALRAFRAQFSNGPHATQAAAELDAIDAEANSQAVIDTLHRYQAAYESRDTGAIQSMWPSLGRDDLAKIDGFFKATRSAKMVLQPLGPPKFADDTATIACKRNITVQMKDGTRQRPIEQNVTVRLKKSGAAWVITALE